MKFIKLKDGIILNLESVSDIWLGSGLGLKVNFGDIRSMESCWSETFNTPEEAKARMQELEKILLGNPVGTVLGTQQFKQTKE